MSSERHSWFGSVWQHLPAAIAEFPLMTAGEQTKLSWARRIESLDDVPADFRNTVAELAAEVGTFPYLILTPSYASFIVHTTEKLVCGLEDQVRVYELSGGEVRLTAFCNADVSAVEVGCVLLKSWLTITGKNTCGVETGSRSSSTRSPTTSFCRSLPGCAVRGLRQTHSSMKPSRPSLTIWHTTSTSL